MTDAPNIRPMLAEEIDVATLVRYVESPGWWMEQKVDGHRVLIRYVNARITATGRNGQASQHQGRLWQPAYANELRGLRSNVMLDGELVGDTFWIFDLPWHPPLVDSGPGGAPYETRRHVLEGIFAEWGPDPTRFALLPCAKEHGAKGKLALECLQRGGEGVMLKDISGPYVSARRSKQILKAKFVKDADFVVTGIGLKGHDNYGLGLYRDGELVDVGRCSAIGKEKCEVGDVVIVRYLYVGADHRLYQPRLMRKRTDKGAEECLYSQIEGHYVNKGVFA